VLIEVFLLNYVASYAYARIYEFLNLVGSYDPPIHNLITPPRSCLGSQFQIP